MSLSTIWHTREWAKGKSAAQIAERIEMLRSAPEWKGIEFDDIRVRHMRQTEIETLSELLASDAAPLDPTDVAVWESSPC